MKVVELAERRGFLVVIDDASPAGPVPRAAAWGEILRYAAFCRELGLPDDADREAFVLAAYRKWGREFPSHLLGEVSYAVWDPADGALLAVADTAGSRPIYYAAREGKVAVSTDTRALRALPWVGSQVDDLTVVAWLVEGSQREDASFYANIKRLPGGCRWIARRGRADVSRWWGPFFPAEEGIKTQADFNARFRELLFDAVRDRLALGGPVTLMMSGGFDSTAVAGVAAALSKDLRGDAPRIHTVSSAFPGFACDESDRIAIARARLPFTGDICTSAPSALDVADIADDVRLYDAPHVQVQRPILDAWVSVAKSLGSSALMGGYGGDELLYELYYATDLRREFGLRNLAQIVRSVACRQGVALPRASWRVARGLWPASLRPALPGWTAGSSWLDSRWDEEVRRVTRSVEIPRGELQSYTDDVRWASTNLTSHQWLRGWFTRYGLQHGLEIRSPYLDRRLPELVLGTPVRHRPSPSHSTPFKPILVNATRDLVPAELTRRRWKVFYDGFNHEVLAGTARAFVTQPAPVPLGTERFVTAERTRQIKDSCLLTQPNANRNTYTQVVALGGVEAWLHALDAASKRPQES